MIDSPAIVAARSRARLRLGELAALLEARRKALGLSHADLAGRTGLSESHVAQLLRHTHAPSLVTLHALAEALAIDVLIGLVSRKAPELAPPPPPPAAHAAADCDLRDIDEEAA